MLENKWMTSTEAAELIGCSSAHVRFLANEGHLTGEKVGPRMWLIEKKSAQDFAKKPAKVGRPRSNLKKNG